MFRNALVSLFTVASLGALVAVPASARPLWGSRGNTPVNLSIRVSPASACPTPVAQYDDGQNAYYVPTNYVAPTVYPVLNIGANFRGYDHRFDRGRATVNNQSANHHGR